LKKCSELVKGTTCGVGEEYVLGVVESWDEGALCVFHGSGYGAVLQVTDGELEKNSFFFRLNQNINKLK